jgi:multidrug transporter EmrE-like cation transporter
VALIIGMLFFAESLGLAEVSGILLILAGVWWVSRG